MGACRTLGVVSFLVIFLIHVSFGENKQDKSKTAEERELLRPDAVSEDSLPIEDETEKSGLYHELPSQLSGEPNNVRQRDDSTNHAEANLGNSDNQLGTKEDSTYQSRAPETQGTEEMDHASIKSQAETKDSELPDPAEDTYQEGLSLIWKWEVHSKKRGYALLSEAASKNNRKALAELAYGYLFGNVLERNFTKAFELFTKLAQLGFPAGQQGLGFMYSLGLGVNASQSKAVLYYTFAALGGDHYAQMAMGYRTLNGISVVESCETALCYYHKVAKRVADEVVMMTGGQLISKVRLIDEDNEATNVYGVSEEDMLHYHDVFVDAGNGGTQALNIMVNMYNGYKFVASCQIKINKLLLGMFYMYGYGGMERNLQHAVGFFEQAAENGMGAANALLGKIYAEGSKDIPKNLKKAISYFQAAIQQKSPEGYAGMGMMYLHGTGVEQDYKKAVSHFLVAAEHGSPEGQYYMGLMHYHGYGVNKDLKKALHYYQLAAQGGNVLAIYNLGQMHSEGKGVKRSCTLAVDLFKGVAERGKWIQLLSEGQKLYMTGNSVAALIIYLLLSEMGIEVAQSNAAYILEQAKIDIVNQNETFRRAFVLWSKAAAQGYGMARVKMGDYYYYGFGTETNLEAAASQYRIASDKMSSAQAMFNVGFMFEHGLGVTQDYHLAKRYYDMAADSSGEAVVPAYLALFKMNLLHYISLLNKVHLLSTSFEGKWDILFITMLSGLLIVVILWRRRH